MIAARHTTGRSSSTCPPELPEVLADAGLLERVIANLIENALRYSPAGAAGPGRRPAGTATRWSCG